MAHHDHIVQFSGGIGSFLAARRVAEMHGTDDLHMIFTDTIIEDSDLYRFLVEAACCVYGQPVPADLHAMIRAIPDWIKDKEGRRAALDRIRRRLREVLPLFYWFADGRDPWSVFRDVRFIGNSQRDPCSAVLKRKLVDWWKERIFDRERATLYFGIDASESHRHERLEKRLGAIGWRAVSPMIDPPFYTPAQRLDVLRSLGIEVPRLYTKGFAHNNCGGFCVKAGQGHFAHLLRTLPEVYRFHEQEEEAARQHLGRDDVAIMRSRIGGKATPMTMREFRERLQAGEQHDAEEVGGCGCMVEDREADELAEMLE